LLGFWDLEIKQFIQAFKAQKYERKFFTPFPEIESAQTKKLSHSVIFDKKFPESAFMTPSNRSTLKNYLRKEVGKSGQKLQFNTLKVSPTSRHPIGQSPANNDDDTVII
jgi:hypothetical protein